MINRRNFLHFAGLITLGMACAGIAVAQPRQHFHRGNFSSTGNQVRFFGPAFAVTAPLTQHSTFS
ncbi:MULTISPECIES: twin-arginine translocation signal domain-containing protein [Pseudomonas]|uniref:twin-arginine translocation signal domain-containing protein n=1 Tax=Pseudomonas TaxID=286 RepID=UPI0011AF9596|nr:twin-arginine translocation signal domain-containing protein [Pseudomonas putida]QNG08291.1 twin-arginine translocation signal domain-containing protein [Pseudomonas putida]HDS1059458.1 twin-arginine translocation signal domain-containing protein [Pseudomonas putida]